MKAGRKKEKGGWALAKRQVRESSPSLSGTHFYRAAMSIYSGKAKMKKSYGERMLSEFGGEHKFPLEEKGYGLKHISEMHRGNKAITRHTFQHPETGHVAKVTHVHDMGTGEKTASWTHHERTAGGLQKIGHGVGGEGLEQHLTRVHKESLQAKSLVLMKGRYGFRSNEAAKAAAEEGEQQDYKRLPKRSNEHCATCGKVTAHRENASGIAACTTCGTAQPEEKSFGGSMDIRKAEDIHMFNRVARSFGYKHSGMTHTGDTAVHMYTHPQGHHIGIALGSSVQGGSGARWNHTASSAMKKVPGATLSSKGFNSASLNSHLAGFHGTPALKRIKSFGGTMDISKSGEGRTMEWIAALFGYAEERPEEDMGNVAGLGKGPTAEWTRPDGWGVSLTARPTMQQFNLHGPDGALYQGLGKHELFTTLRKIHHGPWFTHDRPDMTPVGPINAVHRSLGAMGESLEDAGFWIIKHKKGSKTLHPLSDAKKQQRGLAFRQYGSALRLKKPRLAKPPGKPLKKSLRVGGPVSKSVCTACHQTGAIFVMWKGPEGLQKGYRVCPVCNNDGQPLNVEKGIRSAVGGALHTAGKKISQFGGRMMGGKTKMPTPKSTPNASAKGLTVHMYGGVKGGQHQSEKVYPKSPADMHSIAERERKGTNVIHVEGPPHLVSQFSQERTLHHSSGGAKLCPGCKYHAAVGALKGGGSQSQAASA